MGKDSSGNLASRYSVCWLPALPGDFGHGRRSPRRVIL